MVGALEAQPLLAWAGKGLWGPSRWGLWVERVLWGSQVLAARRALRVPQLIALEMQVVPSAVAPSTFTSGA